MNKINSPLSHSFQECGGLINSDSQHIPEFRNENCFCIDLSHRLGDLCHYETSGGAYSEYCKFGSVCFNTPQKGKHGILPSLHNNLVQSESSSCHLKFVYSSNQLREIGESVKACDFDLLRRLRDLKIAKKPPRKRRTRPRSAARSWPIPVYESRV